MGTKYRTMASHVELVPNPNFKPGGNIDAQPRLIQRLIRKGEVFETDRDMLQFNGPPSMSPKFVLAEDLRIPTDERELEKRIAEFQAELAKVKGRTAAAQQQQVAVPPKPLPKRADEKQLRSMSEAQLRELAENEEVTIDKCRTKDDLVKALLV